MITDVLTAIVILGAEKVWVLSSQVSDRQTDTLLQLREVWYVIMDILVKQLPSVYTICLLGLYQSLTDSLLKLEDFKIVLFLK